MTWASQFAKSFLCQTNKTTTLLLSKLCPELNLGELLEPVWLTPMSVFFSNSRRYFSLQNCKSWNRKVENQFPPLCLSLSYFPSFLSDPANWRRQTNLFTGILENLTHIFATKEITGILSVFFSEISVKIHRVWTESGVWLKHHRIFFFKGVADPYPRLSWC